MKTLCALAALCLLAWLAATPSTAQTEQPIPLAEEIAAQQKTIEANQTQIEEKLAAIAEEMRQARIYASRGGNVKK